MFDKVTNILEKFTISESSILAELSNDNAFLIDDDDFIDLFFDEDDDTLEIH